jgi:hypothetical protein
MNIKKLTAVFLILSLMVTPLLFSACGDGGSSDIDLGAVFAHDEEPEPIIHKVGFIYRGFVVNSTHNMIWENSRTQLERNLGIETYFIEGVLVKNFMEAVDLLIDRGVTIIVSTHHGFSTVAERAAAENKDLQFINFGGNVARPNMASFQPLLYQPANVCGLAASLNSRATSIGIVVDGRMFNSNGVVNSYIQGAKEVIGSTMTTYVNYASSEKEADVIRAIDDLVDKGNDVIMLYLSTDYGIRYCEQIGVNVIAYAGNLPELAPNHYMTGFYFNVDSYITEQVRFIQNDGFLPAVTIGEMETGHSRLIQMNLNLDDPDSSVVSLETVELTDLLFASLIRSDRVFVGEIVDIFGNVHVERGVTLTYKDVLAIDWMDFTVGNNEGFFSEPTEPEVIQLVVRGTAVDD